jgi:hypothetical protein
MDRQFVANLKKINLTSNKNIDDNSLFNINIASINHSNSSLYLHIICQYFQS